jgi:DNA repair exonuclease SbcCD ATPase subunit
MNSEPETTDVLAIKIGEVEAKLELLEKEISEIGMPAGYDLQKRLEALKVEEKALRRNFEESQLRGEPDSVRLAKIETLLRHIENEEASVEHEAHFLHQSNPSSVILAAQAAAGMIELWRKGIKKVLGDHHPFGSSVFVNHTHEDLVTDYGYDSEKKGTPKGE